MTDRELLEDYVVGGRDAAFEELVRRHATWVYASAVRQVRDPGLADDVAQAAFILLARKAGRLRGRESVAPWLFSAVGYCARAARRSEGRRKKYEGKAAAMNPDMTDHDATAETLEHWDRMSGHLDGAIGKLGGGDREAILLRFFEKKSLAEVGAAMGVSEEAAKKRVSRAVERLRGLFARDDVVLSVAAIAAALERHAVGTPVVAGPLASQIAAAALDGAKGVSVPGSSGAIANGATKLMAWKVINVSAACVAGAVLATGVTVMVVRATTATATAPTAAGVAPPAAAATQRVSEGGQVPDRSTPASVIRRMDYATAAGDKQVLLSCMLMRTEAERQMIDGIADNVVAQQLLRRAAVERFGAEGAGIYPLQPTAPQLVKPERWKVDGDRASGMDRQMGSAPVVALRQRDGQWVLDVTASSDMPQEAMAARAAAVRARTAALRKLTDDLIAGEVASLHEATARLNTIRQQTPKGAGPRKATTR